MNPPGIAATPFDGDVEAIRIQAEEHPLIEDIPPATPAEHCLRLMHLRAYDEAVAHAAGRDVLDVGCNTGYGTLRFAPVARRVVGVDVSPRAIEAARQRVPDGRAEFVLTSGFDLPFPDDSFDLVTSFQVLEHVPDPLAYLGEIKRVVRPGGTVILATPNAATRLDPGMTPWNRFHVYEYLTTELRDLLLGVFAQVSVLGMFGAPELYETEIRRVDAARRRIRRNEEGRRPSRSRTGEAARSPASSPAGPSRARRASRLRAGMASFDHPGRGGPLFPAVPASGRSQGSRGGRHTAARHSAARRVAARRAAGDRSRVVPAILRRRPVVCRDRSRSRDGPPGDLPPRPEPPA